MIITIDDATAVLESAVEELTDTDNAERIIQHCEDTVRYVDQLDKWLIWNGKRWVKDKSRGKEIVKKHKDTLAKFENVIEVASKTLFTKGLTNKTHDEYNEDAAKKYNRIIKQIKDWNKTCKNTRRINDTISAMKMHYDASINLEDIDKDGLKLGVANGVVDVHTGKMSESHKEDYVLKSCPIEFDETAECPRFEQFITEIFENDDDTIKSIQQMLGSALIGRPKDKFWILQGGGSNGKSALMDIMSYILGQVKDDGYAISSSPAIFVGSKSFTPEYFIARLLGARMLILSETEDVQVLKSDLVKQVVPDVNETISARVVRGEVFEFVPEVSTVLLTNNLPTVYDSTDGIWRRLVLVKFDKKFEGDSKDRKLPDKLRAEATGILNWLLEGARAYIKNDYEVELSDTIRTDTREWREDENTVETFWDKHYEKERGCQVQMTKVRDEYHEFYGFDIVPQRLTKRLKAIGVEIEEVGGRTRVARGWRKKNQEELELEKKADHLLEMVSY